MVLGRGTWAIIVTCSWLFNISSPAPATNLLPFVAAYIQLGEPPQTSCFLTLPLHLHCTARNAVPDELYTSLFKTWRLRWSDLNTPALARNS